VADEDGNEEGPEGHDGLEHENWNWRSRDRGWQLVKFLRELDARGERHSDPGGELRLDFPIHVDQLHFFEG
jgi:hypothetical protein